MSCIFKCDRCGKIIDNASESIRIIPSDEPEHSEEMIRYAESSRISLHNGLRKYDLCLECKMELYDWLYGNKEESK